MKNIHDNAQSSGEPWSGHAFAWKRPETWMGELTTWLMPRLQPGGIQRLLPGVERDICWDDEDWMEIFQSVIVSDNETVLEELSESLGRSTLRTYHGTRTLDAGTFHREGVKVHDRPTMTSTLRSLVKGSEELALLRGDRLDQAIIRIDNTKDVGRLYVVADDRTLLERSAHYLIYGSEWASAVLGGAHRRLLKTYGSPTLLEIDLPLKMASPPYRWHFAREMVREWTRATCNRPNWTPKIDFSFCLQVNIPATCVVGHSHPSDLRDPLNGGAIHHSSSRTCAGCG